MNRAAAVLVSLFAWGTRQMEAQEGEHVGQLGLEYIELGILRQLVYEFMAVNQIHPDTGVTSASGVSQEEMARVWRGIAGKGTSLRRAMTESGLLSDDMGDIFHLGGGSHGMLVWEFGAMRHRILQHLAASRRGDIAHQTTSGEYRTAGHELAAAMKAEAFRHGRADLRDLATLRSLDDMDLCELVSMMPPIVSDANHTLCSRVSRELRWILALLPPGDRFAVALGHYALVWIQWANLRADDNGTIPYQGASSITQAWWLSKQAQFAGVRQICEVGFNAGHSAWAFLSSSPGARMVSFDLMATPYTRACHRVIRSVFPRRHTLVEGFSNVTIPLFVKQNLALRCDLIYIDGGHLEEEATADLVHMSMMAHAGTLLILDDVGCPDDFCDGPKRAWDSFLRGGRIEKLACHAELGRKWCYARFLQ